VPNVEVTRIAKIRRLGAPATVAQPQRNAGVGAQRQPTEFRPHRQRSLAERACPANRLAWHDA
jgi:hypothetical protein